MATAITWFIIISAGIALFIWDENRFNEREAQHDYEELIKNGYTEKEAAFLINNAVED
ncbi:hypothetical protein Q5R05_01935 [Leuconostoc carnosum]|uniref:hypothetical protein n=1 Tax=Leuconostoc carnosum TaxID=1252 RepID=UPI000D516EDE|nr:hypothetical protein [Leuconostoc carnosum]WLC58807.1 hypothetical protein HTZ88_01920 [Leuconostoc carnosum]WLC98146.1 hypothetical protein Q5R05_01935 [Leuconostoc carnosum]SPJ44063.1 conserved hypothetical protein [Leuconostoc carnosum]